MNVRKVKRMSKRTVSTLLSFLMVLSLFTVVFTVPAAADFDSVAQNAIIFFDNSKTNYHSNSADVDKHLYWYYGGGSTHQVKLYRIADTNIWKGRTSSNWGSNVWGTLFADQPYDGTDASNADFVSISGVKPNGSAPSVESKIGANHRTWVVKKDITDDNKISGNQIAVPSDVSNGYGVLKGSDINKVDYHALSGANFFIDVTNWEYLGNITGNKIYLYYGGYHKTDSSQSVIKKLELTKLEGNIYGGTISEEYTNRMFGYFVSTDGNKISGTSQNGVEIGDKWDKDNCTSFKTASIESGHLMSVTSASRGKIEDTGTNHAWVNAKLYNYRYNNQISGNNNTSTSGKVAQDSGHHHFSTYNQAVAEWYEYAVDHYEGKYTSSNVYATPLYQGNFRQGEDANDSGTLSRGFNDYNFVSVANGANRATGIHGNGDSTNAAALGLVDKEMLDTDNDGIKETLAQNGVEIPQFSDNFSAAHKNYQWDRDILFPMDKKTTDKHHIEYYYDASVSKGNRYYDKSKDNIAGSGGDGSQVDTATGRYKMNTGISVKGDNNKNGYFPFNTSNPSDKGNLINGFGTRFDIDFIMPTGRVLDKDTDDQEELVFRFSGDDDVWVYIDGYLALDLGGSHNNAEGEINLTRGTCTLKSGNYVSDYKTVKEQNKQWSAGFGVEGNYKGASSNNIPYVMAFGAQNTVNTKDKAKNGNTTDEYNYNPAVEEVLSQTNQKHTLTVFYMERGEFDSNFSMSYLLPSVDPQKDNELKITQKVNADEVNEGLRLDTMNIANKDIFVAQVGTQHMKAATDNMIKLPVSQDFQRRNDMYENSTDTSMKNIQTEQSSYTPIPSTRSLYNEQSEDNRKPIYSAYSWIDNSLLLGIDGFKALPVQKAYKNSGVGLPYIPTKTDSQNNVIFSTGQTTAGVPLFYDQSAIFYNQFTTKSSQSGEYALVHMSESASIARFITGSEDNTGTHAMSDVQNSKRELEDYYTTELAVTGCSETGGATTSTPFTANSSKDCYLVDNKSTFTYNHVIRTGTVKITKALESGVDDKTENGKKTEYTFEIKYKNLFGDTVAAVVETEGENLIKNVNNRLDAESWKTANLVGKRSGTDADGAPYTSANEDMIATNGRFGLVAGSSVTFSGIPVGTIIQVSEYSEKHPITNVESVVKTVGFNGKVAEGIRLKDGQSGVSEKRNITVETSVTSEKLDGIDKTKITAATSTYKMTESKWEYTFTNTYSNIPILYRYVDRKVQNNTATDLTDGYTYFTKNIDAGFAASFATTLTDDQKTADSNWDYVNVTTPNLGYMLKSTKDKIIEQSPQIINVLCTYDLSDGEGGKYYPGQRYAYSQRKNYDSVKGELKNQFEIVDVTNVLNNVLDATFGSGYDSLTGACGDTPSKWDVTTDEGSLGNKSLRNSMRDIIEQAKLSYKNAHNGTNEIEKQNLIDMFQARGNNYFYYSGEKYYMIMATYKNTLRRYDVNVLLYAPTGGITTEAVADPNYESETLNAGAPVSVTYSVPFNGLSNLSEENSAGYLGTGDADYAFDVVYKSVTDQQRIKALKLDETGNKLFRIRTSAEDIYFAYWEREVRYYDGKTIKVEWVPVSTNFNYHYRVNDNVNIRAVYRDKNGNRWNPDNHLTNTTVTDHLGILGKDISKLYSPIKKTVKRIYWKTVDGVKKYAASGSNGVPNENSYTVDLGHDTPVETDYERKDIYVYKEQIDMTEDILYNGDNVVLDDKGNAIHRVTLKQEYRTNPDNGDELLSTKEQDITDAQFYQVGNNVPQSGGGVEIGYDISSTDRTYNSYTIETNGHQKQDRTRVDIMFGVPTANNNEGVVDASNPSNRTITQVGYVLYQSPAYNDLSEAVYGTPETLRNHIISMASDSNSLLRKTSSAVNGNTVTINKDSENKRYTFNDGSATYTMMCSIADTNGGITLSNKNRCNVVIDMPNTENSRKYYYTVFLIMKRGNEYYVSDTPATFNLNEAHPAVKNKDGKRAYLMTIKNGLYDPNGSTEETTYQINTNPSVGRILSNYTTAIDGRELSFTTKTNVWVDPSTFTPYTGELERLKVGNLDSENGGIDISGIKTSGSVGVNFTESILTGATLNVEAYFKRIVLGKTYPVTVGAYTKARTQIYDSSGKLTDFGSFYDNSSESSPTEKGRQTVPYNHSLKVVVTSEGEYTINNTALNSGLQDLIDDGKIVATLSQDKKTWTAQINTALADDNTISGYYATLLANLPSAVPKSYKLTVTASTGGKITKINGYNLSDVVDTTNANYDANVTKESDSKVVVSVLATDVRATNDTGLPYRFTVEAEDSNYKFKQWTETGVVSGLGSSSTTTYTYIFKDYGDTICADEAKVRADFEPNGVTIKFDSSTLKSVYDSATSVSSNTDTRKLKYILANGYTISDIKVHTWKAGESDKDYDMTASGTTYSAQIASGRKLQIKFKVSGSLSGNDENWGTGDYSVDLESDNIEDGYSEGDTFKPDGLKEPGNNPPKKFTVSKIAATP